MCREACISFMELCDKKNNDTIWLDEVAAMQTMFSGENNDLYQSGLAKSSASDSGEGITFRLVALSRILAPFRCLLARYSCTF